MSWHTKLLEKKLFQRIQNKPLSTEKVDKLLRK